MRVATFAGEDGRAVYINPDHVRAVFDIGERLSMVQFAWDHAINIPLPAQLVVDDLKKAITT